ncbi:MAG: histidinol-phosphate transaminase [Planctomycetota bacterium]
MKRGHGGSQDPTILDFSANVNPLGLPEGVMAALQNPEQVMRYPSPDARPLCEAAGRRHGIGADRILAGAGASELIYLLARHFQGKTVRIEIPAFTEYEDACEAMGLVPTEGETDVVILANPKCPEAILRQKAEVLDAARVKPGGTLVVDETFLDFSGDAESLVEKAASRPGLIVLRALTKFYALAGLRVGYLVAAPATVAALKRLQAPWTVSGPAQMAAVAALADHVYARQSREVIPLWREELANGLRRAGLQPLPSCTNFILCRVPDAGTLCKGLLEKGLAARNCDSFTGLEKNRYVRFAVRRPEDNVRLIEALMSLEEPCRAAH